MLNVIFMRENGLMIRLMGMESICTWTVLLIKDSGTKINNMVRELKRGLMDLNTKAIIWLAKNMVKELLDGEMDLSIVDSFSTIILRDMANTIGLISANSLVSGKITRWKEEGYLHG